jgi:hypothetical protein
MRVTVGCTDQVAMSLTASVQWWCSRSLKFSSVANEIVLGPPADVRHTDSLIDDSIWEDHHRQQIRIRQGTRLWRWRFRGSFLSCLRVLYRLIKVHA